MKLGRLDHVNIRTANLDGMVHWYGDVLDMVPGDRPDFDFPGAWLYADGFPIIHLVGVSERPASNDPGLEHFAIRAEDLPSLVARLTEKGVAHSIDEVPGFPTVQVNFRDPDGHHIHVDFDKAELAALGGR